MSDVMEVEAMACDCHECNGESHSTSCLPRVPVFRTLSNEEKLLLHTVIRSSRFAKGQLVFREGESSHSLFVLNQGLIKISKVSEQGKEHILRFLFPGDFFGQAALFQEKSHYANAEVIEAAEVCQIDRDDFHALLERNPAMTYRFLVALSEQLEQADDWAGAVSLLEVEQRLAKLLLQLELMGYADMEGIKLPAAKKEIAAMIGATPETLSRKLTYLESLGIIAVNNRTVRILARDQLNDIAGGSKR
jgi:CRP-like cAMP-binding protein